MVVAGSELGGDVSACAVLVSCLMPCDKIPGYRDGRYKAVHDAGLLKFGLDL